LLRLAEIVKPEAQMRKLTAPTSRSRCDVV